jgi:dihydrofolate reductase
MSFLDTVGTILLGGVTYRMFADYWPKVTTGEDEPFADKLNATPKIVFSKTLDSAPWGEWGDAKIVRRSAAEEITELRPQPGKDMVMWGSISLAQSLMREGLIDEYQLVVCPVVLGDGRPLFPDKVGTLDMSFLEARTFDLGSVLLRYQPARG